METKVGDEVRKASEEDELEKRHPSTAVVVQSKDGISKRGSSAVSNGRAPSVGRGAVLMETKVGDEVRKASEEDELEKRHPSPCRVSTSKTSSSSSQASEKGGPEFCQPSPRRARSSSSSSKNPASPLWSPSLMKEAESCKPGSVTQLRAELEKLLVKIAQTGNLLTEDSITAKKLKLVGAELKLMMARAKVLQGCITQIDELSEYLARGVDVDDDDTEDEVVDVRGGGAGEGSDDDIDVVSHPGEVYARMKSLRAKANEEAVLRAELAPLPVARVRSGQVVSAPLKRRSSVEEEVKATRGSYSSAGASVSNKGSWRASESNEMAVEPATARASIVKYPASSNFEAYVPGVTKRLATHMKGWKDVMMLNQLPPQFYVSCVTLQMPPESAERKFWNKLQQKTWEEALTLFLARFGTQDMELAKREFYALKQEEGQSCAAYYTEFEDRAEVAGVEAESYESAGQFQSGLHDELRRALASGQQPGRQYTSKEVFEQANQIETLLRRIASKRPRQEVTPYKASSSYAQRAAVGHASVSGGATRTQIPPSVATQLEPGVLRVGGSSRITEPEERGEWRSVTERTCYRCNQKGHLASSCTAV